MGVVFAVRGDSFDARYSSLGKTPGYAGTAGNTEPKVVANTTGINGSTVLDYTTSGNQSRATFWPGRENTPEDRPRSMLWRVNFVDFSGRQALGFMGGANRGYYNYMGLAMETSKALSWGVAQEFAASDSGDSGAQTFSASTWYDILFTWSGTNSADGVKIYRDTTLVETDTSTRSLRTPFDENQRNLCASICIGDEGLSAAQTSNFLIDEFVIFDEIVDPASVTLTSGAGSLNGASRTAYIDAPAFEGGGGSGSGGGGSSQNPFATFG